MEYKVVSRLALYESEEEPSDGEVYMPAFEFEEVDVVGGENPEQNGAKTGENGPGGEEQAPNDGSGPENGAGDGFAFRLFAGAVPEVRISLREDADENIVNERPPEYYFLQYSEAENAQFAAAAVDFAAVGFSSVDYLPLREYVLKGTFPAGGAGSGPRVFDATAHNASLQRRRPKREGKKKREMKVACRERRQAREKAEKKAEKDEKKRRFAAPWKTHKKPKAANAKPVAKPKYRTE